MTRYFRTCLLRDGLRVNQAHAGRPPERRFGQRSDDRDFQFGASQEVNPRPFDSSYRTANLEPYPSFITGQNKTVTSADPRVARKSTVVALMSVLQLQSIDQVDQTN